MYAYIASVSRCQTTKKRNHRRMPEQMLICKHLAEALSVLAHPHRIRIIEELHMRESCQVQVLVEKLCLSQPTVSKHLGQLRRHGLVEGRRCGRVICYSLTQGWLADWLAEGTKIIETRQLDNAQMIEALRSVRKLWQPSAETGV